MSMQGCKAVTADTNEPMRADEDTHVQPAHARRPRHPPKRRRHARSDKRQLMERVLDDQLAMADRHVAEGERVVARQRDLAATFRPGGHGAALAHALLAEFEKLLALHVEHRDRLRRELPRHHAG